MPMFRKKPIVIEAEQITSYHDFMPPAPCAKDGGRVWRFVHDNGGTISGDQVAPGPAFARIHTLEGVMRADIGDWIIRGVNGEFYPCKPDIFEKTYEDAEGKPHSYNEGCLDCGGVYHDKIHHWFTCQVCKKGFDTDPIPMRMKTDHGFENVDVCRPCWQQSRTNHEAMNDAPSV